MKDVWEVAQIENVVRWLRNGCDPLAAATELSLLAAKIRREVATSRWDVLWETLEMVRDADNDCAKDGLPTIPAAARAAIDSALSRATGNSGASRT